MIRDKDGNIMKGMDEKFLTKERLWDGYWLFERYPERFKNLKCNNYE